MMEVQWSAEAIEHLARCARYPGALDLELDWVGEAVDDVDAVQVDPYWSSRVRAMAIIGYSAGAGAV